MATPTLCNQIDELKGVANLTQSTHQIRLKKKEKMEPLFSEEDDALVRESNKLVKELQQTQRLVVLYQTECRMTLIPMERMPRAMRDDYHTNLEKLKDLLKKNQALSKKEMVV